MNRPDPCPGQGENWESNGVEHTPDLSIPAFVDGNVHDCDVLIRVVIYEFHIGRGGHPVFQKHALTKVGRRKCGHFASYDGAVRLLDLVARVRQLLGERAVVGEEEQAGGIRVQSTDRIDALLHTLNEVHHRVRRVAILRGRHVAEGLIQDQVDVVGEGLDSLSINTHVVDLGIRLRPGLRDLPAINRYASGRDQVLAGSTRGDSRAGEQLL